MYTLSLTSALDGAWWSTSRPGRFAPRKENPLDILQEGGRASEPVWTGVKNLSPTGIRCPYRLTRSGSLYKLSYPEPRVTFA